jgi:hypothetical protein
VRASLLAKPTVSLYNYGDTSASLLISPSGFCVLL